MLIKIFLQKKLMKGKFKNFIFFLIRVSTRFFYLLHLNLEKLQKIEKSFEVERDRLLSFLTIKIVPTFRRFKNVRDHI